MLHAPRASLANFPNAYADIAAYDYQNEKYMDVLGSLLAGSTVALPDPLAENIPEILIKKLIWGSDLPMIIASESFVDENISSYKKYLEGFILSMREEPGSQTNLPKKVCHAVMRTNPARFLFG